MYEIHASGVDLIGSGQNRTILTGLHANNCLVLSNGADSNIQGMKIEMNIAVNNANPCIKNVRLINDGAFAGIVATNGSHVRVKNALITDYLAGIWLEDSSCIVQNCTIDSCRSDGGGGIINHTGPMDVHVQESIITNNSAGFRNYSGSVDFFMLEHSDIFENNDLNGFDADFVDLASQIGVNENFSLDPVFTPGPDHGYYLSAVSAGQSVDSPCIDAGFESRDLTRMIEGTTRTDGIFDMCILDIGYHGNRFNDLVAVGNINNDEYSDDDPVKTIAKTDKSDMDTKSVTVKDTNSLFSLGPKDVLVIQEGPDGSREFLSYFQDNCELVQQTNPDSPQNLLDASMSDLDGDGVLDLVVLEAEGPTFFVNDQSGSLQLDGATSMTQSKAIDTVDFNKDGKMDILIATSNGIFVQIADDHLEYSDFQTLESGDTEELVLYDFDRDGDSDLVTVDIQGTVRFYENCRSNGFSEVGTPVWINGYGKMMVQDRDNDGQMDVLVEIAPGVNETVQVGSVFGEQSAPPSGKRAIRYVLSDHLGSAKMLINDQCEVVWPTDDTADINKLLPFGQEIEVNESTTELSYNLNFTNKEIDRALGLNYFGSRYYHPDLPWFISVDPVRGSASVPISWNRYLYCQNDPLNMIDPDGRYGQGFGWNPKEWAKFVKTQAKAAKKMLKRADKLEKKAEKLDEKGKEGGDDLRKVATYLRQGAADLKNDGTGPDGKVANALGGGSFPDPNIAAASIKSGNVVFVNKDHKTWNRSGGMAQYTIGHESLHTGAGLDDEKDSQGFDAYKFGEKPNREAYRNLKGTEQARKNPDHIMDGCFWLY